MKKVKLEIKINVSDDFEPGMCSKCPYCEVSETEVFYHEYETKRYCTLGFDSINCPFEV